MKRYIKSDTTFNPTTLESHVYDEHSDEELDCYFWSSNDVEYVLDQSIREAEEEYPDIPFSIKVTLFDSDEEVASYSNNNKTIYQKEI